MPAFAWDERYRLSVPEIDAQHMHWFAMTNAVWEQYRAKSANTVLLQKALSNIVAYARKHFKAEEALMRRIRFPQNDFAQHCSMHNAFVERVNALARRCRQGHARAADELMEFMIGWLVRHIIQVDVKYVSYFMKLDDCGNRPEPPARKTSLRIKVRRGRAKRRQSTRLRKSK